MKKYEMILAVGVFDITTNPFVIGNDTSGFTKCCIQITGGSINYSGNKNHDAIRIVGDTTADNPINSKTKTLLNNNDLAAFGPQSNNSNELVLRNPGVKMYFNKPNPDLRLVGNSLSTLDISDFVGHIRLTYWGFP